MECPNRRSRSAAAGFAAAVLALNDCRYPNRLEVAGFAVDVAAALPVGVEGGRRDLGR